MNEFDLDTILMEGSLRRLIEASLEIGDRKSQAATKVRSVEDVATDRHRLALSEDYRRAVELLRVTHERATELTKRIERHIAEYDAVND